MIKDNIHQLIKEQGSRQRLSQRLCLRHVSMISKVLSGHPVSLSLALRLDDVSNGNIPAELLLKECGKLEEAQLVKRIKPRAFNKLENKGQLPLNLAEVKA